MVAIAYTKNSGALPATGLTLAEIALYLTQVKRDDGSETVIWDGTQNPTFEIDNVGFYARIYASADLDLYNYFAGALYSGAISLDADWVEGAIGLNTLALGTPVEYTYTVVNSITSLPIDGVSVWVTTDLNGDNTIWAGSTDALGVTRDQFNNKPRLDPGTYYFWRQLSGYEFNNPDTEVVS